MMFALPKPDWEDIRGWLRNHFPDVRGLSVDELRAWQGDPGRPRPVLVDIRADAEQAVSRIADAHLSRSEAEAIENLKALPPDTPIVAYCAVGVRSAKLVRALQGAGFTNVSNLEGAIFAWANRGLPLTCASGLTTRVHPYDEHWGVLLDAEHRSNAV
jgi:rhodanese-related sulfurtransferase